MLSYTQFTVLVEKLSPFLVESSLLCIHEVAERKWLFTFQKETKKRYFLISLKAPLVRFHFLSSVPKCHKSPFSQTLQSHLKDKLLLSMKMINEDRILELSFGSYALIIELFPKGSNLYLVEEGRILASYVKVEKTVYTTPKKPEWIALELPIDLDKVEEYFEKEEERLYFAEKKKELVKLFFQKIKKKKEKVESLEREIALTKNAEELKKQAILLSSYFFLLEKGKGSVEIEGKEISLNPELEPKDQLTFFFERAKKQKIKHESAEVRFEEEKKQLLKLAEEEKEALSLSSLIELNAFKKEHLPPLKKLEISGIRRCVSSSGIPILIGKSDQDNEKLSFSIAKGSYYWFHASLYPGAHVVLESASPDERSIEEAAMLALHFSKSKGDEGEVIESQCKFLEKAKSKGKVLLKKTKTLHIRIDPEKLKKLCL